MYPFSVMLGSRSTLKPRLGTCISGLPVLPLASEKGSGRKSSDLIDVSYKSVIQQNMRFTFRLHFPMMNKFFLDKDWWTRRAGPVTLGKERQQGFDSNLHHWLLMDIMPAGISRGYYLHPAPLLLTPASAHATYTQHGADTEAGGSATGCRIFH